MQPWFVFSCTSRLCHRSCWAFVRHLGSPSACYQLVWVRFLGRRLLYFCNGTTSFNPSVIRILIRGDIHPQPGPNLTALRGSPTARTVASKIYLPRDAHWNINIKTIKILMCVPWSSEKISFWLKILFNRMDSIFLPYQKRGWILRFPTPLFTHQDIQY